MSSKGHVKPDRTARIAPDFAERPMFQAWHDHSLVQTRRLGMPAIPVQAYLAAFAMPLAVQIAALVRFVLSEPLGREQSLAGRLVRQAELK
jgi:hypothetical protein